MKEMKEMKEKVFIDTSIIIMGIEKEISYMDLYRAKCRDLFINNNGIDYDCYLTDMICDGLALKAELYHYRRYDPSQKLIEATNKWCANCEELMLDVRVWLRNDCNIKDLYDFLNEDISGLEPNL